ncbi:MAG: hypothetical protein KDA05_01490 [Phycisphaerales bacterium]|nr:hypothetical protein [Phycisphaerales bacterium]
MNNPQSKPSADNPATPLGSAAFLRAGADGELNGAQAEAFEALEGDAAARVAFERGLRAACARCMDAKASDALRARVVQTIRASCPDAGSGDTTGAVRHEGGSAAPRPQPGRARMPRGRRVLMSVGVSAFLLLAIGMVVQAVINAGSTSGTLDGGQQFTASLASFVSGEHLRTNPNTEAARLKFSCRDFARVSTDFSEALGEAPDLPQPGGEHDLEFEGAARCGVPGGGRSIHARYLSHDPAGHTHGVSIFVQQDTGRLDLQEGQVYRLACDNAAVTVWSHAGLVYYLVADDAAGCRCFRTAMGLPDPVGTVRARD